MAKDHGVYELNERQFGQWKDGKKITGPIGGGLLAKLTQPRQRGSAVTPRGAGRRGRRV